MKKKLLIILALFWCPHLIKAVEAQALHRYMWANKLGFEGGPTSMKRAYQLYKSLLTSRSPLYMFKGYIHFLHDIGQHRQIVAMVPQLDKKFENDAAIQLIFAQSLEKAGREQEADDRFIRMSSKFKDNQQVIFQTVHILIRRKELQNALDIIDKLLNRSPSRPNDFLFHFLKAQIYMKLNNQQEALKNVKSALQLHPQFDKGWLMFALIKEQKGSIEDAIKGYTNFLEMTDTPSRQIEQHLLQLVAQQKMLPRGRSTVVLQRQCFEMAVALFKQQQYKRAISQLNKCLQQDPHNQEAKLLKVEARVALQEFDAAIDTLKGYIKQEPDNALWFKTLHLLAQEKTKPDKIIKALKYITRLQPDNILPTLYLADLHTRMKNVDQSVVYHRKALELADTKELKTKIMFHLGLLFYETKQFNQLETLMHQAHNIKTDFPPLFNLFAYYYATTGNNVEKAQELMKVVLKNDGTNPHFLDTQALIYYKQGFYEKALRILKKVAQVIPHDSTVLTHLSKTLHKTGQTHKAVATIEKALQVATTDFDKTRCKTLLSQWKIK